MLIFNNLLNQQPTTLYQQLLSKCLSTHETQKTKHPFLILLVIQTQSYKKKKQMTICKKRKGKFYPLSKICLFAYFFDSTFYLLS